MSIFSSIFKEPSGKYSGIKGSELNEFTWRCLGMEMSEPYQERIWAILEQLPNIDAPRERVCMGIRKSGWDHYYQTVINPVSKDFQTVGMLSGWVTKEEWEQLKADNFGSRQANPDE